MKHQEMKHEEMQDALETIAGQISTKDFIKYVKFLERKKEALKNETEILKDNVVYF